jgi:hypothetical protein
MAPYSAQIGKSLGDVTTTPLLTPQNNLAQDAAAWTTVLSAALEHKIFNPFTPYYVPEWVCHLKQSKLCQRYPHLSTTLCTGFDAVIPAISVTYSSPNNASIAEHCNEFTNIIGAEFSKVRYIGPASRDHGARSTNWTFPNLRTQHHPEIH